MWLSVHAALAGVPAKIVQDRADSGGFPANAAAAAAMVAATGWVRARWDWRGEHVGAAPGERVRRAVAVGVVVAVAVAEWCAAGGLAWFPWIWGGFGLVLGRNPANATSRGREAAGEGEGESGASGIWGGGPGGATPGRLSGAAGGEGRGGRGPRVWGIYPLEVTPLGRRKARISKHAASQHFDCSPR